MMERVKDVLEMKFRREIVAGYRKALDDLNVEKLEMDRKRRKVKKEAEDIEEKINNGSLPLDIIHEKKLSDLKAAAREMATRAREQIGKLEEAIVAFDIVKDVIVYPSRDNGD